MRSVRPILLMSFVLAFTTVACEAAEWGLKEGTVNLQSIGPMAFGPDGILFVGDTKAATIFALDTGDRSGEPSQVELNIDRVNEKAADLLKLESQSANISDLAVNPLSGNVYLSVGAQPRLIRINASGNLSQISLKKIAFSKVVLPNPPADEVTGTGRRKRNRRGDSITDLAYSDGKVLVSGLSKESSPSNVREIAFPFADADVGSSVEIFHGAHGKYEDYAAVRTFVPLTIDGKPNLLAAYVCTPLVRFPLENLKAGEKVRGTTVAELGNQNRPMDMIVYNQNGEDFLLLTNSRRGVMKISTKDIGRNEGITERVGRGDTAGQSYDTVKDLQGVEQLDRLNEGHAVILVKTSDGAQNLRTIELP